MLIHNDTFKNIHLEFMENILISHKLVIYKTIYNVKINKSFLHKNINVFKEFKYLIFFFFTLEFHLFSLSDDIIFGMNN